jgi:polysaccharide export outer membrane protein
MIFKRSYLPFLRKQQTSSIMILWFSCLIASCSVTRKNPVVFDGINRDTIISFSNLPGYSDVIQVNDELDITISSLNPDMDEKFNKSGIASAQNNIRNTYKVDSGGKIKLHHVGSIEVAGMKLNQFASSLEKQLEPFYKDLLVNVRFANRNVTVTGMVNNPKVLSVETNGVSIFDALAQCGDLKPDADLNKILVFRDSTGVKQVGVVNLENNSIFNSKWYYLLPNDVVVVRKDETKILKMEKKKQIQSNLSLIVSLVSLAAIILNIIIK